MGDAVEDQQSLLLMARNNPSNHEPFQRTGTIWTAMSHIITGVIGAGVLSLAWSVAHLGWIAGPLSILSFAAITIFSSNIFCDCYKSPDPESGPIRNRSFMEAVDYYLGDRSRRICQLFLQESFYGGGIAYTITAGISMRLCGKWNENNSSNDDESEYAEIVVIRHGETAWNVQGRVQGHLDVELNEVGRQQAVVVADRLSKETATCAVYSSDLKRASETANIIASHCGVSEVIQDTNLRERHLGDLQGTVYHEAAQLRPEAYQASLSGRTDQEIPGGGESLDQLFNRCTSSLQSIGTKHIGERVVVVTHGGVIRALHKRAAPTEQRKKKILNTSVNIFHLYRNNKWLIKTWGDVTHLNNTNFLESDAGGDNTSG